MLTSKDPVNEFELTLPCADQFYEAMVVVKLSTSIGEEFWSEYDVISFQTDADTKVDVDPTCTRERVKITPEIMVFKVNWSSEPK